MVLPRNSVLNHSDVAGLDVLQTPVWVFDLKQKQVWWANPSALTLWKAQTLEELTNRDRSVLLLSTPTHLFDDLESIQVGQTVAKSWTVSSPWEAVSISCLCSRVCIEEGRPAILVEATQGPMTSPLTNLEPKIGQPSLLEGVLNATNQLLAASDGASGVSKALAALGPAAGLDGVYICENHVDPTTGDLLMSQRFQWRSKDVDAEITPTLPNLSYQSVLSRWYETLSKGEPLAGWVRDFPPCEQEIFAPLGIRALLAIPIEIEGHFWGCIGFEACHRHGSEPPLDEAIWLERVQSIVQSPVRRLGEAIARQRTQEKVRENDRLLNGVATATTQLLTTHDYHKAIHQTLAALGYAAAVHRVYILEHHPHPVTGEPALSQRYEWLSEQVNARSDRGEFQNQPGQGAFSQWLERLSSGQLVGGVVRDLPSHERALLQTPEVRSFLMFPIEIEGKCWGILGFEDCRSDRLWLESEKLILRAAAASIGGAISRHQTAAQLANLNAQLERRVRERTAELMLVNRKLTYNAYHDALTGLPNRILLIEELEKAIGRAKENPEDAFGVLFLDLDRFKAINDGLGHAFGDKILVEAASRLIGCVRYGDLVARMGGDEFAILLKKTCQLEDATRIAERIKKSLTQRFCLEGQEVFTTVSIGIALSSPDYDKPEELLRDADIVMNQAKLMGKSCFEVFDTAMHEQVVRQLRLENDLRRAVTALEDLCDPETSKNSQFRVVYQPIVSLSTNRISGFEALMRWYHPELGWISPVEFIPIAEETGLIVPLGAWILDRACQQLRFWKEQLRHRLPLKMSVNLSGRQFAHADLIEQIDRILESTGIEGHHLKLEVTESVIMDHSDSATSMLLQLKERKIQLCMDDFGTGYSSLSYLHRFPLDTLKIDRSFVSPIKACGDKSEIVQTIISLAHNLGMSVVAEGVETPIQQETLRSFGCEFGQGYLFSKPISGQAASQLLSRSEPSLSGIEN